MESHNLKELRLGLRMTDLRQKIRLLVTPLINVKFRLSASIIMFIDSQGNVCPCDFFKIESRMAPEKTGNS